MTASDRPSRPAGSAAGGGPSAATNPGKRAALWAMRLGGTAAGFAYIAYLVDFGDLGDAVLRVSPLAFVAACLTTSASLVIAGFRWRLLLAAYGAPHQPRIRFLVRAYWIGFFYNTYLPGGIGGDLVRGVVTRRSFGERGTTASMTVVLVERALGLCGLLLLVSATYLARPLPGTEAVLPYSAALLLAAALAVGGLAQGRRLAPYLPARLGRLAGSLPTIERPLPFLGGLLLSLGTQGTVAVTGWLLLDSVSGGAVSLGDAFVLVPLAMATAFFPFTVGGAGAREAAFVTLGSLALGMEEADALAVSLLIWASQLVVAGSGGVLHLVAPIRATAGDEVAER